MEMKVLRYKLLKRDNKYPSLERYLLDVGIENAVPGTATLEDAMKIYYQWSTEEEIQKYGFLGIFIKLID
jgi:ASC-1-like (ASCH) protein